MGKGSVVRTGVVVFVVVAAGAWNFAASPAPFSAVEVAQVRDAGAAPPRSEAPDSDRPAAPPNLGFRGEACEDAFVSGPYINSPGTGPDGTDESVLQSMTLGMSTIGYNCNAAGSAWVADDFVVPEPGLDVDQVVLYAYQTSSGTTSTITGVRYQIWNGPPNAMGSAVVFGDLTTNRMTGTTWANAYRRTEGSPGTTNRPIMTQACSGGGHLPPGTYWIQFGATGTLSSGPWLPPVAIWGTAATGNALIYTSGIWHAMLDSSPSAPAQGAPFHLVWCCPSIALNPAGPLSSGAVGLPYPTVTFTANATNPTHLYDGYSWSVPDGALPDGLSLDPSTGVLSGTPTFDGIYPFTVRATAALNPSCFGEASCTIVIGCTPVTLKADPSQLSGVVGAPVAPVTFTASGGTAPYTYAVTAGAPPAGLKLSAEGILSGTPTAGGTFTFTVEATDANGCRGSMQYTAVIAAFDLNFYDDYGRSRLCANSSTGAFTYTVLWGIGAGAYSGVGTVGLSNGQLTLVTPAGLPFSLNLKVLQRYAKASASFTYRALRVASSLVDNNTKDDPPGC